MQKRVCLVDFSQEFQVLCNGVLGFEIYDTFILFAANLDSHSTKSPFSKKFYPFVNFKVFFGPSLQKFTTFEFAPYNFSDPQSFKK